MSHSIKSQSQILAKLGIHKLNSMQEEALLAITSATNTVLLSPTGSGKTVAFLLPVLRELDATNNQVQVVIVAPSRELVIQIEQVVRQMGTGYKVIAVYGGRAFSKDKVELAHTPTIIVATPGRLADHLRNKSFETQSIKTMVLDEFDKSLEVGFEAEMREIIHYLPQIEKRILTSATKGVEIPDFIGLINPIFIDYSTKQHSNLTIKRVLSPEKDKLQTLVYLLQDLAKQSGIIFCNFKDTIQYVSDYLETHHIPHGLFYGGLEQKDRERALIQFRNGTHKIIIATDLAARGIDIPELDFIIHYQLPHKAEEFTHRNGRTARMNAHGMAYVLQWEEEFVPDFITTTSMYTPQPKQVSLESQWVTLFISGGRKDKISKGDIAGLFFKQGHLQKEELGIIELKHDCAFVSVPKKKVASVIEKTNNTRLKKKKVRITVL